MNEIIEMYKNSPLEIYNFIETKKDLINVNIKFLQGYINGSIYHIGYNKNKNDNLIELNRMNFITLDYEPGIREYKIKKKDFYYSRENRNYIIGYLEKKHVKRFKKYFANYKNFKYIIFDMSDSFFNVCFPSNKLFTTFEELPFNLTRNKYNNNIIKLDNMEWQNYANIYDYEYDDIFYKYPKINRILNNYVYIVISSVKYGEFFLDEVLLDFLCFN